jgi:hypothetical protein
MEFKKSPIRRGLLFDFPNNFSDQRNRKIKIVPQFLDESDLFDVIFGILCDIDPGFAGLAK